MNKKNRGILIVILFFANITILFGQNPLPELTMPSPNAASLGLYGEIPVSLYSGLPSIVVPIHTIEEGPINLPIYLSYHASGVRPDQHPGWVGLNWNLNAGGAITRVAHDLPDEFNCPNKVLKSYPHDYLPIYIEPIKGENAGYYYNRLVNTPSNWGDLDRITYLVDNYLDGRDTEPDEFTFNFLGYSGSFFLDDLGNWKVKSNSNIKVIFHENHFIDLPPELFVSSDKNYLSYCIKVRDNLKSFGGFTLIDEKGTKYIFGAENGSSNTDAIEYSVPFFYQIVEQWVATTWNLTKVIYSNGQTLEFSYEPDDYISNMYLYFQWKVEYFLNNNTIECGGTEGDTYEFGNGGGQWAANWINPRYGSYLGNLIRPVYLKTITTENIEVSFTRENSTELKYKNEVYLRNRDLARPILTSTPGNQACLAMVDWYSYWPFLFSEVFDVINAGNYADYEALLDALVWKKLSNITVRSRITNDVGWQYSLGYNDNSNERLMLKEVTKKSLDGRLSIPPFVFEYYDNSSYSLPDYFSESTDHWGFFNNNLEKTFTLPRTSDFVNGGPPNLGGNLNRIYELKEPTTNLEIASEGSLKRITYSTGGYTEFKYEQHTYSKCFDRTSCFTGASDCIETYGSDKIAGGLRISEITSSAGLSSLSTRKTYHYVSGYSGNENIETLPSSGILGGKSEYVWYSNNTHTNDSDVKSVERLLYGTQSVLPLSINSQGNHVGYTGVIETLENGSYTKYKFTNFESDDGTHYDEAPLLVNHNDISIFTSYTDNSIERGQLLYKGIYDDENEKVREELYEYQRYNDGFVKSLYLTGNVRKCYSSDAFKTYFGFPYKNQLYKFFPQNKTIIDYRDKGLSSITTNFTYNYNSFVQLRTETVTNTGNDEFSTSYYYPFDLLSEPYMQDLFDDYRIGEVIQKSDLKNGIPIGTKKTIYKQEHNNFVPSEIHISPNSLINLKKEVEFDSYDEKGNVRELHLENGNPISYIWAYNKSYPVAKIENKSYTEVESALAAIGSPVNNIESISISATDDVGLRALFEQLRSNTLMEDAMITSYTYDPLVGITSQTDPNGISTYYEYDDLGRLKQTKDAEGNVLVDYTYQYKGEKIWGN